MTDSLGSLLTAYLQEAGICSDDYQKISKIVYDSLDKIDQQMKTGEFLTFPRGNIFTKTFDWRDSK